MEVRFKSHATSGVQTSLDDLVNVVDASLYADGARPYASDPDGWLLRATAAVQQYPVELSASDYDTLHGYLSLRGAPGESVMPVEAVTTYMTARNSGLFDKFELLSHPVTREAVLVGFVDGDKARRRFMICQWGPKITTIKKLRSWRYRARRRLAVFWNENRPFADKRHGAIYAGVALLIAVAGPWALFAFTSLGWWVFFVSLIAAFVLVGWYLNETGTKSAEHMFTGVVVVNVIAAVVVGFVHLNDLNTRDRTQEVLVCRVSEGVDTLGKHFHWKLHTPQAVLATDPGFYEGAYYESPSRELVDKFVDKWVKVTIHGYVGDSYVTDLTVLREGSCG